MWALGLSTVNSIVFRHMSLVDLLLVGNSNWSTSICENECIRNNECNHDMVTRTTDKSFNRTATIDCLVVSHSWGQRKTKRLQKWSYLWENQCFFLFRLRIKQADRPATYDDIQACPAMKSLPADITSEEAELVRNVIAKIPDIPDDY